MFDKRSVNDSCVMYKVKPYQEWQRVENMWTVLAQMCQQLSASDVASDNTKQQHKVSAELKTRNFSTQGGFILSMKHNPT